MTLTNFLHQYDFPGSVVLLEGKRNVRKEDEDLLTSLGQRLAEQTRFMRFRSGNAKGSDYPFSFGVSEIAPSRLEGFLPYKGHRKKETMGTVTVSVEDIDLSQEPEDLSGQMKGNETLIQAYLSGARNRLSMRAPYLIRDTMKVTGTTSGISPASFTIFYDDLSAPGGGGTGHTMEVFRHKRVPFVDQSVSINWLVLFAILKFSFPRAFSLKCDYVTEFT